MLSVRGVTVQYRRQVAVRDIDIELAADEVVAVLGPSGGGKSTLLRAIAGLEPLAGGVIEWDGADLADVPVHRREFGMMFQEHALFPHRDVRANVEFGLRMQGIDAGECAARVDEVLGLVGLARFGDRDVATLSGGERSRVALARTIAPHPRLLMLDEPLGALDRDLRERLVGELRAILGAAGIPALYVTHDQAEAFALADRVVVMRGGSIVQVGAPSELWSAPADPWVARFLGWGPVVTGRIGGDAVLTQWGGLPLPAAAAVDAPAGAPVLVGIRPGSWRLDPSGELRAVVARSRFRGPGWDVECAPAGGGATFVVASREPIDEGTAVQCAVDGDGVVVFPATVTYE